MRRSHIRLPIPSTAECHLILIRSSERLRTPPLTSRRPHADIQRASPEQKVHARVLWKLEEIAGIIARDNNQQQ